MDYKDIDGTTGEPNGQSTPHSRVSELSPETTGALQAIAFLRRFHPASPWVISSFGPGGQSDRPDAHLRWIPVAKAFRKLINDPRHHLCSRSSRRVVVYRIPRPGAQLTKNGKE